jgi:hypothetical protein
MIEVADRVCRFDAVEAAAGLCCAHKDELRRAA